MKQAVLIYLWIIVFTQVAISQTDIEDARSKAVGSTVTITGIVTNGNELGAIRYIQDESGAIPAYSTAMSNVVRGDMVTVTGALKLYNNLLEIDPVTSFTVVSKGNGLPQPKVITLQQMNEAVEGMLVRINKAMFSTPGTKFSSNTTYNFTANGITGAIFVRTNHPLIGQVVPSGTIDLIGIASQFSYDNPATGYQLLLRDINDIASSSQIRLTSDIKISNIATSGFNLDWTTDAEGSSGILYGNTPQLELGKITDELPVNNHIIKMTGASPSELFYVQAFSVKGTDTAKSAVKVFITASASKGEIKVYFTQSADQSVARTAKAVSLPQLVDDTLSAYINRAKYSLDFCVYNTNLDLFSNIRDAINNAYKRGVAVRVIVGGSTTNLGLNQINPAINKLESPTGEPYAIMHHKFIILDAESPNPNDAIVWTGSTNLTEGNINEDANNVVIVQDQSLAKAFKIEFEEMWGSSSLTPDRQKSKFGTFKTNNTPHDFVIGGKRVECYFSPSDGTNDKILESINSADSDLSINTMLITRSDLAYAITDRDAADVSVNVIVDSDGTLSFVDSTLSNRLKTHYTKYNKSGMLHNKYLIADQSNTKSDPLVLTGSHNWSNAANNTNDENTLIIHDSTTANIYYQEFLKRFLDNNGSLTDLNTPPSANYDEIQIAADANYATFNALTNDNYIANVTLNITKNGAYGNATLNFNKTITYRTGASFVKSDTIVYKICYVAAPNLCDTARVVFNKQNVSSVNSNRPDIEMFSVYPNPASSHIEIAIPEIFQSNCSIKIYSYTGKLIQQHTIESAEKLLLDTSLWMDGLYLIMLESKDINQTRKILIRK